MDGLTELANAPILGLIFVVVILLIGLNTYLVQSAVKNMNSDRRDSTKLVNDLRVEVSSLRGQLEVQERLGSATSERAFRAEFKIEEISKQNAEYKAEILALKLLLTRTQARVIQLVTVITESGIVVPPEASFEMQTEAVRATPKDEGAEPLSSDIDAAKVK